MYDSTTLRPATTRWTPRANGPAARSGGAGASPLGWYVAVAVLVVGSSLLGAALGELLPHRGRPPLRRWDRRLGTLALAVLVLIGPASWLATAGQDPVTVVDDGTVDHTLPSDPSAPDPFSSTELTYGSGTDPRPAYGDEADLITETVDASRTIQGWDEDRRALWGFAIEELPLNARVWYPHGDGPFPLVLLVHGNKSNATHSEDGFRYLGEQLAGHGVIAVSVDQNFLNTGVLDRDGGLRGVEEARGRLLLEHLRTWKAWNEQEGTPFTGKVDLVNVGLLGHSRGGEAIVTATHLAQRDGLSGMTIRSLLALAPSEGQYRSDDGLITLRNVDYLVLQGSHDADVVGFGGLNQYARTTFDGDEYRFAAALAVERANHGQFNSRWGRHDIGYGLPAMLLDDDALLSAEDQRRVAKLYSTAFFTGTLLGNKDMLELFRDYRVAEPWLPETNYVSRFTDSTTVVADDGTVRAEGGSDFTTTPLPLRSGPGQDTVHRLTWEGDRLRP